MPTFLCFQLPLPSTYIQLPAVIMSLPVTIPQSNVTQFTTALTALNLVNSRKATILVDINDPHLIKSIHTIE